MSKISFLSSLIAFSLLFPACSSNHKEKHEQEQKEQKTQTLNKNELILKSTNNKIYKLEKSSEGFLLKNSKAKILILDIFATWCPPCQAEASHLSSLQNKYSKEIKIIGVSIEDGIPNTKLESFKKNYSANYTFVNSPQNREVINIISKELQLGNNFGIPLLVIYKDGKLVKYYQGAVEEEFIESDIKRALKI